MRILVTGAAGFIGSNSVRYWLERHPDDHVVAFDLLTYAETARACPTTPFVQGDIADDELAGQTLRDAGSRWSSTSPPSRTTPSRSSTPGDSSGRT
jgi:dTDP-D-glucose 4,6-dehydratase